MSSPRREHIPQPTRSAEHLYGLAQWVRSIGCRCEDGLAELHDGAALDELVRRLERPGEEEEVREEAETGLRGVWKRACALVEIRHTSVTVKKEFDFEDASLAVELRVANVLQLILGYAVQCPQKQDHVAQIMSLDQEVQHAIMLEVDVALKKIAHLKSAPPTPSPFSVTKLSVGSAMSKSGLASGSKNESASIKRLMRENQAIRSENEEIHALNTDLFKQVEALQSELNQLRQDSKEQVLRKELELGNDYDERESAWIAKMERKAAENAELSSKVDTLLQESKGAQALRDQIEILNAQVNEMAKKDASIQRLKDKAALANDLAKQVQALEESNAELLSRNVEAESQIKQIPRLKKELEKCKEAHTEALLDLNEVKALLEQKSAQLCALQDDHNDLCYEKSTLQSGGCLGLELAQEEEEQGESNFVSSVSELNPQVRENLARLEKENEILRKSVSEQGEDHVAQLTFENDSLNRLKIKLEEQIKQALAQNKGLEKALEDSRAALAAAEATAEKQRTEWAEKELELIENGQAALAEQLVKHQNEVEDLMTQFDQAKAEWLIEGEQSAERERFLRENLNRVNDEQRLSIADRGRERREAIDMMSSLQQKLDDTQAELVAAQKEHEAYEQDHRVSIEDYEQEHAGLNQRIREVESDAAAAKECLEALTSQHEDTLAMKSQLESDLCDLVKRHQQTTDSLQTTTQELSTEQQSRSKAERSAERYRLQSVDLTHQVDQLRRQLKSMQVQRNQAAQRQSGNAGSDDQEMLTELKRITDQLKLSKSDNERLRADLKQRGGKDTASVVASSAGFSEMARGYEDEIEALKNELHVLNLARTQDMMRRKEMEGRLQQLAKDNEELVADNNSLRLRNERFKMSVQNFKVEKEKAPDGLVLSARRGIAAMRDKENAGQHHPALLTPRNKLAPSSVATPTSGLRVRDENAMPPVPVGEAQVLEDGNQDENCNQQ